MAVLHYRFYSEKSGFRQLPLDSDAISIADLKVLIAEKNGLGREFARKVDLRIFHEDEKQEYKDDYQMVQAYSKVLVQRTAWMPYQDIQHEARTALTSDEWKTAEERKLEVKKKSIPPEFLCRLCSYVISQPMLVKCTGNCGLSACRDCIQKCLQSSKTCPFCKSGFLAVFRNKRLEQLLSNPNLDAFDYPKRPVAHEPLSSDYAVFSSLEAGTFDADKNTENKAEPQEPSYFMYLLNNTNLNLLRRYDMIVVEILSNLACALFNGDNSLETFVIPCAPAGGGTSYAIGGFVRISPFQRVDPEVDPTAEKFLKQWETNGQKKGAPEGSVLFRVNWIEKYGKMPMLPSRKQPLYGLLGNRKRYCGDDNSRLQLEGALEVHLLKQKYDEVSTCIRDYIKFGSRPTEPFQYPSGGRRAKNSSLSVASVQNFKSAKDVNSNRNSPNWDSASCSKVSFRSSRQKNSDSVSQSSDSSECVDTSSSYPYKLQQSSALPYAGPSPMGINGTVDISNPYLGYCAILPFLTVEQFKHIRKLQRKAKKQNASRNKSLSRCFEDYKFDYKQDENLDYSSSNCSDSETSNSSTSSSESSYVSRTNSRSCSRTCCSRNESNSHVNVLSDNTPCEGINNVFSGTSDKGSDNPCDIQLNISSCVSPLNRQEINGINMVFNVQSDANKATGSKFQDDKNYEFIESKKNLVKKCLNNAGLIV